jgi:hypothetical protein
LVVLLYVVSERRIEPWSAGFGINPHLFAGVCKAGRKKAPNSEELGV